MSKILITLRLIIVLIITNSLSLTSQITAEQQDVLLDYKKYIQQQNDDSCIICINKINDINGFIEYDNYSYTPLGLACKFNRLGVIKYLLNKLSIDINLGYTDDIYEYNVLDIVITNKNLDIFKLLINRGVNYKDIFDEYGNNALSSAVKENQYEIAKILLEKGLDANGVGDLGSDYITIPLIIAVSQKDLKMVKLLMEFGADPNLKDKQEESAFSIAKNENLKEFIEVMDKKID